jgi:hypothetical protein
MNEQLAKVLKPSVLIPVGVGLMSLGTGFVFGYLLGRRSKVEFETHEIPEQMKFDLDVEDIPEITEDSYKTGDRIFVEPEGVITIEEFRERGGDIATPAEAFILQHLPDTVVLENDPEEERRLVFASDSDDWNYEIEVATRTTTAPYVLHKDEFYAEEMEYAQSTLTYYAGDDIMVDEEDAPVYNYAAVVGPLLFGHGSQDPNVFHVRNDQRRAEYEVIYDSGEYATEVLGLDHERAAEIRGDNPGPPKMRPE